MCIGKIHRKNIQKTIQNKQLHYKSEQNYNVIYRNLSDFAQTIM
jgi:hypothetical protein